MGRRGSHGVGDRPDDGSADGRRRTVSLLAGVVALVLAASALLIGATADAVVGSQQTLVVEDDRGDVLLSAPVESDGRVVLEYTHSVENSTVRDVYRVRPDGLELVATEFSSFGAGLPAQADVERTDRGTFRHRPAGTEPHEPLVATGHVAGHDLVVDGQRYDLSGRADGGTVRLRVTDRRCALDRFCLTGRLLATAPVPATDRLRTPASQLP